MAANSSLNLLLRALRDNDISYNEDELRSALADSSDAQAWVEENLTQATLLSKEEISLYLSLENAGVADNLSSSCDLSLVRTFNDDEISTAISELQRSTAMIEKQSDVLRGQQDAMQALVESNAKSDHVRSQRATVQERKWKQELEKTNSSVEDLAGNLRLRVADLEKSIKTSDMTLKHTAAEMLLIDDKILTGLKKLSNDLNPGQPDEDENMNRLRESCARLIKYTVEGIRTRLDRIYLESLPSISETGEAHDDETTALQEELESLYSEILPVAQMSTEQQFLQPALRAVAAEELQGKGRSRKALQYIASCLEVIISRLGAFLDRAEEYTCHKDAVATVLASTKREIESDILLSSVPAAMLPSRRRADSRPKSPVRKHRRDRSSLGFEEELEPEKQLLSRLNITLPSSSGIMDDATTIQVLEKTLTERRSKQAAHAHNIQSIIEANVLGYVQNAYNTLQLLHDSLLSETGTKTMQLLDQDAELLIQELEREIEDVKNGAKDLDVEKLKERSVARDRLIERWS